MTGYGRSDEHNDQLVLTVEIRTINSRFLDFSPRLPKALLPFEDEAYRIVKKRCERGRVSLSAKIEYHPGEKNTLTLNTDKLEEYMMVVKDIQKSSDRVDFPTMGDILRLPEIFVNGEQKDENELKTVFLSVLNKTLNEVELNEEEIFVGQANIEVPEIKKRCFNKLDILETDYLSNYNMEQAKIAADKWTNKYMN